MKKLENMTKAELEKALNPLVKDAINELNLFRITLKDWKRYYHTYNVLKNNGIIRDDLAHVLLDVAVSIKTDYQEEELQTLREEIREDVYSKTLKKASM